MPKTFHGAFCKTISCVGVLVDVGGLEPPTPACKQSSKNQISAASGVAYISSSTHSNPLNWTDAGPKFERRFKTPTRPK